MNYEHKSNIKRNVFREHIGSIIKTIISICIILTAIYFFFPGFFPSVFTTISSPLWNISKNYDKNRPAIPPETENPTILELQNENTQLKSLLGRPDAENQKHRMLAYILKKPPFSAYDIFIIDLGSNNGIKVKDKVYALGDVLVGEIIEVEGMSSKVKLYSSSGEKYEVLIGNRAIQVSALGKGGGNFEAILPREVGINEGEIVTVPNISSSVFGVVQKVIVDPARYLSTILFSQPVNLYEQKWLLVEKTI